MRGSTLKMRHWLRSGFALRAAVVVDAMSDVEHIVRRVGPERRCLARLRLRSPVGNRQFCASLRISMAMWTSLSS